MGIECANEKSTPHWALLVGLLFVATCFASWALQPMATGKAVDLSDGKIYTQVASQIAEGRPIVAHSPWVYRVGTPFLVALFGGQFLPVNFVAAALIVALLYKYLNFWIKTESVRFLVVALYILQYHAAPRAIFHYSETTDPWFLVFLLWGLICIEKYRENDTWLRLAVLTFICAAGVWFRETALLVGVILLFIPERTSLPKRFLPLACGIASWLLVRQTVIGTSEYQFAATVVQWITDKPFWTYILGWFIAFGAVLIYPILAWRDNFDYLKKHTHLLAALVIFAALGYVGGSDTERLLYWSMPIMYALIGRSIERVSMPIIAVAFLVVFQSLSQRVFFVTPSMVSYRECETTAYFLTPLPIFQSPLVPASPYDLSSYTGYIFGSPHLQIIGLAQYLCVFAFLLFLNRKASDGETVKIDEGSPSSEMRSPSSIS